MGYNLYMCIICGIVKDDSWGSTNADLSKIINERKGCYVQDVTKTEYYNGHILTCDICTKCIIKTPYDIIEIYNNNTPANIEAYSEDDECELYSDVINGKELSDIEIEQLEEELTIH